MNEKTPRQDWFDFLEKYSNVPRPEDRLPYDNAEFLQKIKLYFDNRSVVCDGKIDLSYVFFRIKDVIDQFIDRDFRHEIDHIKGDLYSFRDRVNKELHDLKHLIDKSNENHHDFHGDHNPYIYPIDKAAKYDFDKLLKTLRGEIENTAIRLTRDINCVKDYVNELCVGIEETHKKDIDDINARIDAINTDINDAVKKVVDELRKEIEGEIENTRNELQVAIDNVHSEIQSLRDSIGKPNGIASLDKDGKISSDQLPEWTNDVIEVFADYTIDGGGVLVNISLYEDFKKTNEILEGEEGKLYVDITNNNITYIFRWTGREWVCVNNFVLHSDIADIKSEISNIQSDITSLQSDVENLRDTCATKDELNSAVEDLEKEISNIAGEAGSENERISTLENDVDTLKNDVETNKEAIEGLQESKQDKLIAGEGIDITDNVISSTVDTGLYEVVANLPTSDIDINKIYVVPVREKSHNKCTEYIYVDGRWEVLGNKTNLDDYYTTEQIDTIIETINAGIAENAKNVAENTSNIEKNTSNIESNTTKISQIEDALAELGVEIGDDESKLSTIEKQVEANTAAIETKQDKLTAGTGIEINEINGETVIACTLDTSLYIFCTVLPTTDINPNKIYVTPSNTPGEDNVYIEWLYVDGAWEKIGELHSDMDMSDYYTKSEVDAKVTSLETSIEGVSSTLESTKTDLQAAIDANASAIADLQESKQNNLVAGTNISLTDNADGTTTISCDVDTTCYKIVASLPEKPDDADADKIFMVPSDDQESQNEFVEYIWVDTTWEQVGTNSYTKAQVDAIKDALQASIDTLTSTVESNNASVTESIEKLESSVETLESSLESTKSDLQSQIDTNASSIETNTSNIETNASNIETNASAIEDLKTQISNLEGAETSDVEALKEQVESNTSNIETNTEAIEANATAISDLDSSKQDKLTAGTGISITEIEGENVIACTIDHTLYKIVTSLPSQPDEEDENKIFLVAEHSESEGNIYVEYIWVKSSSSEGNWEKIGEFKADTDLSSYATIEYVDTKVTDLQSQIDTNTSNIATNTIAIESNTSSISALEIKHQSDIDSLNALVSDLTGVEHADFENVQNLISNVSEQVTTNTNAISDLQDSKQDKLTAGDGISINTINGENVIACTCGSTIAALQEQVDSIDSDLTTAEDAIKTNTDAIETLQGDVSSNATAIEELQNSVENLESSKQDVLTAGAGIEINEINGENVIACTLDTDVFVVEGALPENPSEENVNKIYVVPSDETEEGNRFTEYIWIGSSYVEGAWEKLGEFSADIDLSAYATTAEVKEQVDALDSKIESNTEAIETNASTIEALQSQLDSVNGAIDDLKERASGDRSSIDSNTNAIEALQSQLNSTNNAINEVSNKIDDVEASLQDAIDNVESSLNSSINELNERLSGDRSSIESNTSAIENLENTKQDVLSAGTGISIEDNVIACTLDTKFCIFVDKLPETGEENKLYLVKKTGTVKSDNLFDEWIWGDETGWEYIGGINPEVDLADYYTKTQVDDMINELKNSLLNDLKPYLENISSSIETLQGDVTNIKETVEDTSDDIKIITQILAGMTGTTI